MENIRDLQCGKTSQGHSPQMAEKTSDASSKNSARFKTQIYLSLNLKNGQRQEKSWVKISLSPTGRSMLNSGIFPNEERESTLSQILMADVPQKYYLSQKACLGILRRASVRGKELPPVLKAALERQAAAEQEDGSV